MSGETIDIQIDPDDPASIQRALDTEWLLTNGLGGYAMGTVLGANTRRYHGLLVAAAKPPVGRLVTLHSMIEQLIVRRDVGTEEVFDLSTQQFVGGDGELLLHPNGWRYLAAVQIERGSRASWLWRIGAVTVERTLRLTPLHNIAELTYSLAGASAPLRLRLRPIIPLRDFHAIAGSATPVAGNDRKPISIRCGDQEALLWSDAGNWRHAPQQWNQFGYSCDRARGQDWIESAYSPGELEVSGQGRFAVRFTALLRSVGNAAAADAVSPPRRSRSASAAAHRLRGAAQDFIVRRRLRNQWATSIIAGYPWFGDWGRDTMIALPGLMLCTGRIDEARSTLLIFAESLRNGLIPNLFDDYGGGAHYNSVDASLWFIHAVHQLWQATLALAPEEGRDEGRPKRMRTGIGRASAVPHALAPVVSPKGRGEVHPVLLSACRDIIAAYRRGTDFNIRMDDADGLIAAGDEGSQLTWMDAKRDGVVFTPRHGKAVEINALWFNALRCVAEMSDEPREREALDQLSERTGESFRGAFWWSERACLHDVLRAADGQLRPNQIFAVSLPFSPLDQDQQRSVVKVVGDRLLTPFGLRTLDIDDPEYRGRYEGDLFERDRAYHNGTVWPWLIGPYCEALLRIENFSARAKSKVRRIIQPLIDEMNNARGGRCLGQIAEVYDGDPPHNPGGCPAQAWSVAEVLRVLASLD